MIRSALRAMVDDAEDLVAVLGELEEARAEAWRRFHEQASRPREVRLLSADEAIELARVPRRRLYSLARTAPWAVRVGRKLLVEDGRFRTWLDSRRHVPGEHETTRETPSEGRNGGSRAGSRRPVTRRRR